MNNAKAIYTQGGNSKVYAEFTGTAADSYTTSGRCAATAMDGMPVTGMALKSSVTSGAGATFRVSTRRPPSRRAISCAASAASR